MVKWEDEGQVGRVARVARVARLGVDGAFLDLEVTDFFLGEQGIV